jgi:integrase
MLYETAARVSEILALNVEDLDLEQRRAPIRPTGGGIEFVYWDTGTAHLLPGCCACPTARRAPAARHPATRCPRKAATTTKRTRQPPGKVKTQA